VCTKKLLNKYFLFAKELETRVKNVQLEFVDALYLIKNRDGKEAFFYCDPPYFNAHMGHYGGYTAQDFQRLLQVLSQIKGKFILSSYASDILKDYTKRYKRKTKKIEQIISVNCKAGEHRQKTKVEVLTWNF
jgi:DNA adenine methylase